MSNRGYLGNQNLKAFDEDVEYPIELVDEYEKCMNDPIYFAENYIKIIHVDKGLVPFEMYDYQKDIVKKTFDHRRVAVLTARQAGKTTTAVAIILHYILFNDYKAVAILANKADAAREVLSRIQLAYEALPKWLQQGVKEWNKGSVELENGCKVYTGATTSSSIRGKSVSFLYVDEAAFVEGYEEFFASVYPTISSGEDTKLLLTSTPNGLNHFYKTCTDAQKPEGNGWNGYHFLKVTWDEVPGRGEKWKKETLEALNFDLQKFAQEYEGEFLGSSGTLLSTAALKALTFHEPIESVNNIKVYTRPEKGRVYVLIADVSRGKGLDYSAFHVIDVTEMPYKQVCTFRDNTMTPYDYAEVIYIVATTYNEAFVLVELNDMGESVSSSVEFDFEYEQVLFTESAGRAGKRISAGYGKNVDNGIYTSSTVKNLGCSTLKLLIEQQQFIVNDFDTINELSKFSKKGKSYEAEAGSHDDLVMGLVLFGWLSTQAFIKEVSDVNTLQNLRDANKNAAIEDFASIALTPDDLVEEDIPEHMLDPNWTGF